MPGYWTRIFQRAAQLIDRNPGLDGEAAFNLARLQVDAEGDQLLLPAYSSTAGCFACGRNHNGLPCPAIRVTSGVAA